MMASCNKTKNREPITGGAAASTTPVVLARQVGGGPKAHIVHMAMAGSGKGWCGGFPANCVSFEPDIVVSGAMKTAMDEAANSGSASQVASVFSSGDFTTLNSDYLGTDNANYLKSGTYYLRKVNDNGSLVSYIAGPTYPVTLDNMDFAFQGGY